MGDELRRTSRRHHVREHSVVPGLGQGDVERPRAIGLRLRVNVPEFRHVLADDEQVVLALVNRFEPRDQLVGIGPEHAKGPSRRLSRTRHGGAGLQVHPIVADVEGRGLHEGHPAAGAAGRSLEDVVGMHRADESGRPRRRRCHARCAIGGLCDGEPRPCRKRAPQPRRQWERGGPASRRFDGHESSPIEPFSQRPFKTSAPRGTRRKFWYRIVRRTAPS